MDTAISVRPEEHRARGAAAYNKKRKIDSHGMNPGSAAIKDWTLGFMQAQYEDRLKQYPGIEEATDHMVRDLSGSAP